MPKKIIRCLVLLDGKPPEPDSSKFWVHLEEVLRGFGIEPRTDLASDDEFHHKWLTASVPDIGARELMRFAEHHFGDGIFGDPYQVLFQKFKNQSLGGWLLVVNQRSGAPTVACKACGRQITLDAKGIGKAKL